MATTEIGGLRISLSLNAESFLGELAQVQRTFASFAKALAAQFGQFEEQIKGFGKAMTLGVTAPLAGMAIVSGKAAADLEAAMNRVRAALGNVDDGTMAKLSDAVKRLGPAAGRSAVEAADGLEALALAGVSADAAIGGALEATLTLAAANNADLAPSAALVTDVMAQFAKTTRELGPIVDKVTGALDNSKFGFLDYQLAVAQAGGVAGSVGVSFDEFNTTIAATSKLFQSGSDAGTSFKTFLTSLNPKSKEAERTMAVLGERLGITGDLFFDAAGNMKSMAEIAEILRKSLSGLSEKSRAEALTNMFGADGMRTAIALMQQGRAGFEQLQGAIAKGSAANKLATQMQGLSAETRRLGAAFDALKIALGEAGIIQAMTAVTASLRRLVQALADLPKWLHTAALAAGALAAALGPLSLAALGIARLGLPLLAARFGVLGIAISALINPLGTLVAVLGGVLVRALAGAAASFLGLSASVAALAGPIGLAVAGLGLLVAMYFDGAKASATYSQALDDNTKFMSQAREQALALAVAQGKLKKEVLAATKAMLSQAAVRVFEARDSLRKADQEYRDAKREMDNDAASGPVAFGDETTLGAGQLRRRQGLQRAENNLRAAAAAAQQAAGSFTELRAAIVQNASGGENVDFSVPESGAGSGASGPTASDRLRTANDEQLRLDRDILRARLDLETDARARADLEKQLLEQERAGYAEDLRRRVEDNELDPDRAKALLKTYDDQLRWRQEAMVNRKLDVQLSDEELATKRTAVEAEIAMVRMQADMARTAADRRAAELRLLDLQYQMERDQLAAVEANKDLSAATRENARLEREALDRRQPVARRQVERGTAGPIEKYLNDIPNTIGEINEQLEEMAVNRLRSIEDGFAGIVQRVTGLNGALGETLALFVRLIAQQGILAASNGTGFGGFLKGLGTALGAVVGGGSSPTAIANSAAASTSNWIGRGWAKGGGGVLGGRPGIDMNMLSLNGDPIARVSRGEMLSVTPRHGAGGRNTIIMHNDFRGASSDAISAIKIKLDQLDQSLEGRSIRAVVNAQSRRFT